MTMHEHRDDRWADETGTAVVLDPDTAMRLAKTIREIYKDEA